MNGISRRLEKIEGLLTPAKLCAMSEQELDGRIDELLRKHLGGMSEAEKAKWRKVLAA